MEGEGAREVERRVVRLTLDRVLTLRTALIVGLVMRLLLAAQHSFSRDEAYAYYVSSLSLSDIVTAMASSDRHPPLYYMLLHLWAAVSSTELWLRLPSVGFAMLTITGVHRLTSLLTGDTRAAGVAALLTATLYVDFHHDTTARMLSLAQCGCVWAMVALARLTLLEEASRRDAITLCLCLTTAIHSFYFCGGFLVASAGTALVLRPRHPARRDIWLALAATALLCAPLGLLVRAQMQAGSVEVYDSTMVTRHLAMFEPTYLGLVSAFQVVTGRDPIDVGLWTWTALTFAVLAWQGRHLHALWRRRRDCATFIVCTLGGYLGILLLTTASLHLFNLRDRYFVIAYPLVHGVTALALRRSAAGLAVVVGLNLALFGGCLSSSYLWDFDMRPVAEKIRSSQQKGDLIVVAQEGTDTCLFNYYYDRDRFALVRQGAHVYLTEPAAAAAIAAGNLPQTQVRELPLPTATLSFITQHPTVFLVFDRAFASPADPHIQMLRTLGAHYEVDPSGSLEVTTACGTYGPQTKTVLRLVRRAPAPPASR